MHHRRPNHPHQHNETRQHHQRKRIDDSRPSPRCQRSRQRQRKQQTTHRRPRHIRNLIDRGPPSHRIHKVILRHQARQHRASRRPTERSPHPNPPQHRKDRQNPPAPQRPFPQRQPQQPRRTNSLQPIATQNDLPPVIPVGHMSRR